MDLPTTERASAVSYSVSFVSLISPHSLKKNSHFGADVSLRRKLLVKQSYMLLTWFYYTATIATKSKTSPVNFFIMPIVRKQFTFTKAPMAHKTWSKEQYKYQFYKLKVTIRTNLVECTSFSTTNEGLLFLLLFKRMLPQYETNLFFIKYCNLGCTVFDTLFFNFFRFVKSM